VPFRKSRALKSSKATKIKSAEHQRVVNRAGRQQSWSSAELVGSRAGRQQSWSSAALVVSSAGRQQSWSAAELQL